MRLKTSIALVALSCAMIAAAASPMPRIGVEMPQAGDDGARGLAAAAAIRLALPGDRLVAVDSSRGGFQNPHRDEGSDNDVDVRAASGVLVGFARDPRIVAAIGGLRRNVGDVDVAVAEALGLPTVVLSHRWRYRARNAFCVCLSPRQFIAGVRALTTAHFGRRLLIVLVGDAANALGRSQWSGSFTGAIVATADETAGLLRARADDVDAVIVIADERPAVAMRSSAFRAAVAEGYLAQLVHRGFRLAPTGARRADVLIISERLLPNEPARRSFARRFHAAAGYQPPEEALRAYAAAQILARAGATRDAVRAALRTSAFPTAAGTVRFDRDGYWDRSFLDASPP